MTEPTRFRLAPPDGRHEDHPPLIVDTAGWPEPALAVIGWLAESDIAAPYPAEQELLDNLCGAQHGRSPRDIAAAVAGLGEPAARTFIALLWKASR